ncbi:hypothetical protein [Salinicoccus halitifaciens]|uniref:Syringate O-demethylase/vanillate/3-O-methylgallate O-demethylase n=1 Tax=Salinicoccus halitifaciens TaxID=1073415 RepID=A0ABV2EB80_9STAP|nr:hypothetical protein [Salinicoccus halitifaciens]MCD2137587.1 hypothetical protein [Salinicoccus halitifaciens]
MTVKTTKSNSLQSLIESKPNLVDHFYNDAPSLHFAKSATGAYIPPAFTNWREEQQSWSKAVALLHQSHHMPELFVEGPDAEKFLMKYTVNKFNNFTEGRAKQLVAVTPSGYLIGDCIAHNLDDDKYELISGMPLQNWLLYNAEKGEFDVKLTQDMPSHLRKSGERTFWRFQLVGPNAGPLFEALIDEPLEEKIKFFRTKRVKIRGCDVLVHRHDMTGHEGVEISGPFEDEKTVRDAILEVGKDFGLKPVGTQAYFTTSFASGFMAHPMPGIYTDPALEDYRNWLKEDGWEAHSEIGGSYVTDNIEDYYVTPFDLGYGHVIDFERDFVGKEALQNFPEDKKRKKVCLVWSREDVKKIYDSQLGTGKRYKALELPVTNFAWNQYDEVKSEDGAFAGVSCHAGYVDPVGDFQSIAMVKPEFSEPGTELVLTWGEINGGSRKPQVESHEQTTIKVTVAPEFYSTKSPGINND